MTREIEFRGKCVPDSKYAGEWVTGGYVPLSEDITPNDEGLIMRFLGGGTTITYHVDPDTVGQFTGLVDKNGVKIFEGDIVRIYDSDYEEYSDQQVKFAHGVFGVDNWTKKYLTTLSFFLTGGDSEYSVEVIGNIHDNPELLAAK
jgi:uncharacterized phage protein (TIGR01671 family)